MSSKPFSLFKGWTSRGSKHRVVASLLYFHANSRQDILSAVSISTSFTEFQMNHTTTNPQFPTLGFTVWWSLAGIRVPHDTLTAALNTYGFKGVSPARPSYHIALRRALTALLRGNHTLRADEDEADTSRLFLRTIPERSKGQLVFAVIHENVDFRALGLEHATSLRVRLDKKEGLVTITTQERGDIYTPPANATGTGDGIIAVDDGALAFAEALRPFWRQYKDLHIATDLSRMMRDIVCGDLIPRASRRSQGARSVHDPLQAMSLRPGGGLYFIPGDKRDTLERLEQLVYALPTDGNHLPFFVAQALLDEAKAKGQMARAVHEGFLSELQGLQTDLERLTETDNNKQATLSTRLLAYRKVKAKADMYADLLGMQQADVLQQVNALQQRVTALLTADSDADSTPLFEAAA